MKALNFVLVFLVQVLSVLASSGRAQDFGPLSFTQQFIYANAVEVPNRRMTMATLIVNNNQSVDRLTSLYSLEFVPLGTVGQKIDPQTCGLVEGFIGDYSPTKGQLVSHKVFWNNGKITFVLDDYFIGRAGQRMLNAYCAAPSAVGSTVGLKLIGYSTKKQLRITNYSANLSGTDNLVTLIPSGTIGLSYNGPSEVVCTVSPGVASSPVFSFTISPTVSIGDLGYPAYYGPGTNLVSTFPSAGQIAYGCMVNVGTPPGVYPGVAAFVSYPQVGPYYTVQIPMTIIVR